MQRKFKAIILFLAVSAIGTWVVAIFLFFSHDQTTFTAEAHGKAQIGMIENKEMAFDEQSKSDRVYAIKDNIAYNSRKIATINTTNDPAKVSIDVLLDELGLN